MIAPLININSGGSVQAGFDIFGFAGGNMVLSDGASMLAGDDVWLGFGGGSSTLYLNQTTGLSSAYIVADTDATLDNEIHLNFLGRSAGGVVIDGVETFTSTAGGSGLFVGSTATPAQLGSTLLVTYGIVDTVTAAVTSTIAGSTEPTAVVEAAPVLAAAGTTSTDPAGTTAGGGEDEFGEEGDAGASADQPSEEEPAAAKKAAQCRS